MFLLRAVHATKVLVLAVSLAMPVGLPATAGDGLAQVQTRVRHNQFKHRPLHHAFRKPHDRHRFLAGKRRQRSVTTSIGFSSIGSRDLFSVDTKTRHIRLKDRRHRFSRRDRKALPRVIVIGGYAPLSYGSHVGYDSYDSYEVPSVIPGIGTYAGNLSAYRDEGNGIYFSRASSYGYIAENGFYPQAPGKRAKIIVVTPGTNASACSFESGVCVVRP
ncbi:hypothetical protein [Sinorhizobium alkalisoli]|uniref:Uncharacterized protein n=1 Tax=Sinorhizobium alkalisoli TaxID=1752398 RepID=A0A1E3VB69_9HYPH|nr:hypothetical protein [Sinorhizobium alkalisoli]MCA1492611.1 hypothetical protein [Ensifer sp. NBAIM29]ODR90832.1 hypothetical protein A8M32_12395 [Sinorhizobium alkalisoli]QFI67896.1 hypothetical protein EKH55_3022 [Sinorhizobium alkalisoli]